MSALVLLCIGISENILYMSNKNYPKAHEMTATGVRNDDSIGLRTVYGITTFHWYTEYPIPLVIFMIGDLYDSGNI